MGLLDLILPRRCAACADACGAALCEPCADRCDWFAPPWCDRCGAPARHPAGSCAECATRSLSFDRARAAARYDGPARDALLAFKLLGERRAARELARRMTQPARLLETHEAITFVPATTRSVRERGFNPAELLARALADETGASVVALLAKVKEVADLTTLGREERRRALRGVFAVDRTPPGSVLVVDDVYTTGATADACARALKEGGAFRVDVVVFARSLRGATSKREARIEGPEG